MFAKVITIGLYHVSRYCCAIWNGVEKRSAAMAGYIIIEHTSWEGSICCNQSAKEQRTNHIASDFNTIVDRALVEELLKRSVEGKTSSYLLRYSKHGSTTKVDDGSG